jgi:hypothetical protein
MFVRTWRAHLRTARDACATSLWYASVLHAPGKFPEADA